MRLNSEAPVAHKNSDELVFDVSKVREFFSNALSLIFSIELLLNLTSNVREVYPISLSSPCISLVTYPSTKFAPVLGQCQVIVSYFPAVTL